MLLWGLFLLQAVFTLHKGFCEEYDLLLLSLMRSCERPLSI